MDIEAASEKLDKRRREARPERLVIGGKEFERNDVVARKRGVDKKTIDREDRKGAPYAYINAVKYRPQPDYDNFVLSSIIQRHPAAPAAPRRRRAR